jgi:hypothetical protein
VYARDRGGFARVPVVTCRLSASARLVCSGSWWYFGIGIGLVLVGSSHPIRLPNRRAAGGQVVANGQIARACNHSHRFEPSVEDLIKTWSGHL